MLRWLGWHLDRFAAKDAEMRLLDHASYLHRDGLTPAFGMDEGGEMDAMGLGWVVQEPAGARPLILEKSGGLQGEVSYVAFAPSRGIGVFVSQRVQRRGLRCDVEGGERADRQARPALTLSGVGGGGLPLGQDGVKRGGVP
jgi:hypothetical protein